MIDKNNSKENNSNTAGFSKLLNLVNGNVALARQMETVWGDAETAVDWLNKRAPQKDNRHLPDSLSASKGAESQGDLPSWYHEPPHRTVVDKKK
jgi:hypothetical protein